MRKPTKAALLRAVDANPELLSRLLRIAEPEPVRDSVSGPDDLVSILRPLLAGRENEALVVAAFDSKLRLIDVAVLSEGSHRYTVMDPIQILRWVLTRPTAPHAFAVAHNHPSGDPSPSAQDRESTARLRTAARAVGLQMLDSLVVTDHSYRQIE